MDVCMTSPVLNVDRAANQIYSYRGLVGWGGVWWGGMGGVGWGGVVGWGSWPTYLVVK